MSATRETPTGARTSHMPFPDLAAAERTHASAVRVVAGQATDAIDCAELLEMLGLDLDRDRPELPVSSGDTVALRRRRTPGS